MQFKFTELKKKKVVNILDGSVLGNITDVYFDFPESKIKCFICKDKKAIFCKDEYVIYPCDINKIGDDAVLVCLKDNSDKKQCGRSKEEVID